MALTPRLDLRQTQTLVMTPQLQQAIRLLQMSNLDLVEYVEREIEQNPLLERDDGSTAQAEEGALATMPDLTAPAEPPSGVVSELDGDYDNMWSSDGAFGNPHGGERWRGAGDGAIDSAVADGLTLREHLFQQMDLAGFDPFDKLIGAHLIDLLDEAGYLPAELTPIARQLGCTLARIEATLGRLQEIDPPGLFCRDLRECLALQLGDRDRLDEAMAMLLDNLHLVAAHQYHELCLRCRVDEARLAAMLAEIRALDPKPGLAFDSAVAQPIIPDVIVRHAAGGGWTVELNADTLPRLLVNRRYLARITRQARSKAEKEYLTERLHSANWLVRSLDQRANTILRVATELVHQQESFLAAGIDHLKPLILRDIAEVIGMHESTVSRVTANKYMATPRGTLEMRYFFTHAIASTAVNGEPHSAEKVRQRVKALIAAEEAGKPLSDDRLVTILREEGIDIARRTVAKYRESQRIPSSLDRRRRYRRAL